MAFVRHGTLTAGQVTSISLPSRRLGVVEVMNRDGAGDIFTITLDSNDADVDPTVEGDDCEIVPASSSIRLPLGSRREVTVKLISDAAAKYSIRAE